MVLRAYAFIVIFAGISGSYLIYEYPRYRYGKYINANYLTYLLDEKSLFVFPERFKWTLRRTIFWQLFLITMFISFSKKYFDMIFNNSDLS